MSSLGQGSIRIFVTRDITGGLQFPILWLLFINEKVKSFGEEHSNGISNADDVFRLIGGLTM